MKQGGVDVFPDYIGRLLGLVYATHPAADHGVLVHLLLLEPRQLFFPQACRKKGHGCDETDEVPTTYETGRPGVGTQLAKHDSASCSSLVLTPVPPQPSFVPSWRESDPPTPPDKKKRKISRRVLTCFYGPEALSLCLLSVECDVNALGFELVAGLAPDSCFGLLEGPVEVVLKTKQAIRARQHK